MSRASEGCEFDPRGGLLSYVFASFEHSALSAVRFNFLRNSNSIEFSIDLLIICLACPILYPPVREPPVRDVYFLKSTLETAAAIHQSTSIHQGCVRYNITRSYVA